jgi:hypothetical protein
MKMTPEEQAFFPPFLKGAKGGGYNSLKSPKILLGQRELNLEVRCLCLFLCPGNVETLPDCPNVQAKNREYSGHAERSMAK